MTTYSGVHHGEVRMKNLSSIEYISALKHSSNPKITLFVLILDLWLVYLYPSLTLGIYKIVQLRKRWIVKYLVDFMWEKIRSAYLEFRFFQIIFYTKILKEKRELRPAAHLSFFVLRLLLIHCLQCFFFQILDFLSRILHFLQVNLIFNTRTSMLSSTYCLSNLVLNYISTVMTGLQ